MNKIGGSMLLLMSLDTIGTGITGASSGAMKKGYVGHGINCSGNVVHGFYWDLPFDCETSYLTKRTHDDSIESSLQNLVY